jgi:tetratricopeptide (TPR) repeat protein
MTTGPIDPRKLAEELQSLLDSGRELEAIERCREAGRASGGDAQVLGVVGPFFAAVGEHDEARSAFTRLLEAGPGNPRVLMQLAAACKQGGDLAAAEDAADRLLAVAPQHPAAIGLKADLLYLRGRTREGFELLAPRARAAGAHPGIVVTFARVCRVEKKEWDGIAALERVVEVPGLPAPLLADACFQLAKLYDSVGRFEQAWAAAARANEAKGARFDPDEFDRRTDAMIGAWTRERVERLPGAERTELPLLIVGMPRSGTTLVEQILASHPAVAAGGELPDLARAVIRLSGGLKADPPLLDSPEALTAGAIARESERYRARLAGVAARRGGEVTRVTDKMPLNALHLGVVRAIAPGARVVWCRRDPLDTCTSCWLQNFAGSNPFAYDLTHLGRFHRSLERVMRHWQAALGLEILELPYEQLVAEQALWTRRLLEFAGLAWDERCLRYYESDRVALTLSNDQVRRPVFASSIGRWRRYEAWLGPLRAALGTP